MNLQKISNLIKKKRKELGMTQEELASKLFVTEKAISRWETGRGFPDISLLLPLAEQLQIDVSELLNGEEKNDIERLIEYHSITLENKYNIVLKLIIVLYTLSLLSFLIYLRFEYDPNMELHYFIRLFFLIISCLFILIGKNIYNSHYAEKLENKQKITKFSQGIIFIYYVIFLFNMVLFARYTTIQSYNVIPFHSINTILSSGNFYAIIINIFGNLLIFMPLEYFLIKLFRINKFLLNFVVVFLILLLIEIFQFIFKVGVLDIDDLFLCTLGSLLFYIFYNKFQRNTR
jgi:glycopeptide antibiotics resistance protein/DNA-binding XRE family transcriptional regulator